MTADHIATQDEWDVGISGDKTALVIFVRATKWLDVWPLRTKSGDDAYFALQQFAGPNAPKMYLYSDGSGEIAKAVNQLGWHHEKC